MKEKNQFDADLSPDNPHNKQAAADHRLTYDPTSKVYRDEDGAIIRDSFGQKL